MDSVRAFAVLLFVGAVAAPCWAQRANLQPPVGHPSGMTARPADELVDDFRNWLYDGKPRAKINEEDRKKLQELMKKLNDNKEVDPEQIEKIVKEHPELQNKDFLKQMEKMLQDPEFMKNLEGKIQKNDGPPIGEQEAIDEKVKEVIKTNKEQGGPIIDPKTLEPPKLDPNNPNVPKDPNLEAGKDPTADNEWVKWFEKNFGDSPGTHDVVKDFMSAMKNDSGKGLFDDIPELKNGGWKDFEGWGKSNSGELGNFKPPDLNTGSTGTPPKIGGGGSSPNFGGSGGGGGGPSLGSGSAAGLGGGASSLAIIAGIVGALILAVILFRKWKLTHAERMAQAAHAMGGIDFDAIRSREELVRVFNRVSLDQHGDEARAWNHRVVAEQFRTQPAKADPADEVAGLYERARYAPLDEELTTGEFADARRDLRVIAGDCVSARISSVLALLLLPAAAALAQNTGKLPFGGSEAFRFALYKKDLKALSQPQDALGNPNDSVIVIFGDTSNLSRTIPTVELRRFIERGGAVLIASDSASAGWGEAFGIRITGRKLQNDPRKCYREVATRPYIRPRIGLGAANSPLAIVKGFDQAGVDAVATDRPSDMFIPEGAGYVIKRLAAYVNGSRYVDSGDRIAEDGNNFAASIEVSEVPGRVGGRMLVVANSGVYVNGMMGVVDDPNSEKGYSFDNANWEFTNRTIDWVQAGRGGRRTQCLFVEDGRIVDKFAVELPPSARPPMPKLTPELLLRLANTFLRAMNYKISDLEDNNYFNRLLERWLGIPRLWRIFLITVTVLLLLFALTWVSRGARKHERIAALTPSLVAGLAPRGGVFRQRTAAQLEVGNLYEAARRRVRDRLDVLGATPGPSGRMPPILTANDLPDGPMLYQSVRWLWMIGFADTPTVVSPTDWDHLNALLERATTRAARGDWSFGQEVD